MKIILTGSTGFIGTEVLRQCRQNPAITSVITLTRCSLPAKVTADPKVNNVVMESFPAYPDEVVQQMAGAEACIWYLWPKTGHATGVNPSPAGSKPYKFRYMHLSGVMAERDQSKPLFLLQDHRRVKVGFLCETYIAKPEMVIPREGIALAKRLSGYAFGGVGIDELGAAMIDIVQNGSNMQTFENAELVGRGKALLVS
ncbi:hypothetical protein B0H10DRAFT_1792741 [Mycena sp. CBHHK59/15]|nr:hypothetical protein B0H10DRAFT_1792741 [Mycena sp. CBHHK59/15]